MDEVLYELRVIKELLKFQIRQDNIRGATCLSDRRAIEGILERAMDKIDPKDNKPRDMD